MAARWLLSGRLKRGLVTAVLGLSVAGCGGASADGSDLPPPLTAIPSTSPAPPSPTPTVDPLEAEVLATVDGWLQAYVAALTGPDPTAEGMAEYAIDARVDRHMSRVTADIRENVGFEGSVEIVWSRVDDDGVVLNEENDRGQAVVEACLDGSGFQRIALDSGEPLLIDEDDQPQRHWVWVRVWHIPDVGWRVESTPYMPGWMFAEVSVHMQEWEEQQRC